MENLIHVHIYEPHKPSIFGKGSKNTKSELHTYHCERANECETYSRGQCVNIGMIFGAKCPHGKKRVVEGWSQRAKNYHSQIVSWKTTYADVLWKLNTAPNSVTKVAGGWWLPYAGMAYNEDVPFLKHEKAFMLGTPLLSEEDFTAEVFDSILSYSHRAIYGEEIKSYRQEVVPKFVNDLYCHYRDKYNEVANETAEKLITNYDAVGRKAYLKTIKPGVELVISKDRWYWDGTKLSCKDKKFMVFEPVSWESCYAEFIPDDNATIKITDNDQVTPDTKFAD